MHFDFNESFATVALFLSLIVRFAPCECFLVEAVCRYGRTSKHRRETHEYISVFVQQHVFEPNISKTAEDRDSVAIEHLWEMAYGKSNGHVIDDVT